MERLNDVIGPNAQQRAVNIAQDPYAAAGFFHYLARLVIRTLVNVQVTNQETRYDFGIYGRIPAFIAMIESQGRGSLHTHMLLWMDNTPAPSEIRRLLRTDQFRNHLKSYIAETIHGYVPGLESVESLCAIPNNTEIAYRSPLSPDSARFDEEFLDLERRTARSKQLHTCSPQSCMSYDSQGRYRCKRGAPFPCFPDNFVDSQGRWGFKCLCPQLNGWSPPITVYCGCNNDLKLITNGEETCDCQHYFTTYMIKNQPQTTSLSELMAKEFAFHNYSLDRLNTSISDQHRLLIFRLTNRLNSAQELAAPMMISLLMGWKDSIQSHHYTCVFWNGFLSYLYRTFPDIKMYVFLSRF